MLNALFGTRRNACKQAALLRPCPVVYCVLSSISFSWIEEDTRADGGTPCPRRRATARPDTPHSTREVDTYTDELCPYNPSPHELRSSVVAPICVRPWSRYTASVLAMRRPTGLAMLVKRRTWKEGELASGFCVCCSIDTRSKLPVRLEFQSAD